MKVIFIICFIINLVFLIVAMVISPEKVVIHFGTGGEPNNWGPVSVSTLIMVGINVLCFVIFFILPYLLRITPTGLINLPNKDYWLNDKNKSRTLSIISNQMYIMGTATFVFLFIVSVLSLWANLSDPVKFREDIFWLSFALYIGFISFWPITLIKKFKVPKDKMHI